MLRNRKIKTLRLLLIIYAIYTLCYWIQLSYELSNDPVKAAQYEEMMKKDQFKD